MNGRGVAVLILPDIDGCASRRRFVGQVKAVAVPLAGQNLEVRIIGHVDVEILLAGLSLLGRQRRTAGVAVSGEAHTESILQRVGAAARFN